MLDSLRKDVQTGLLFAALLSLLPSQSEGTCCHKCMQHPKGGTAAYVPFKLLFSIKKFTLANVTEMYNMVKYYGSFCTFNTCDEQIFPTINRCSPIWSTSKRPKVSVIL